MNKEKFKWKEIGLGKLVILFLTGILLLVLSFPNLLGSSGESEKQEKEQRNMNLISNLNEQNAPDSIITYYEKKLKSTLERVKGIGKVEVMLTLQSSKEQIVLKDSPYEQETVNEQDEAGGSRMNQSLKTDDTTVLVTNAEGKSVPYITKELEAMVEGVVVIAEGGDNSQIAYDIATVVEVLFRVPAHKVKVLPMEEK